MLPLHKDAQDAKKGADFHAGLWYDRFFDRYDRDCAIADEGKLAWIQTVTASSVGNKNALARAINRQYAVAEACGGQSLVMSSDWHFVTGLGNNHPVENGFAWHHTLGVPYLTGAAVKGMVRAWCEVWQAFDSDKIKHWFGGKGDEQAGGIIFFDALPTESVKLKADIMTPHYGDWYAKGDDTAKPDGSNMPADWHDPVPIPFLVVDKGASFQFSVALRAGSEINIEDVTATLTDALSWIGAGAKTSTGYGRFSEDINAKVARETMLKERKAQEAAEKLLAEQEAKRASMTPLEAELDRWIIANPELTNTIEQWFEGIDERPAHEQQIIAKVLKNYYEQQGKWKKQSPKQKQRVKKIKSLLQNF